MLANSIQLTVVTGKPVACTIIACAKCKGYANHAIGVERHHFWVECTGCNSVRVFHHPGELFHALRRESIYEMHPF